MVDRHIFHWLVVVAIVSVLVEMLISLRRKDQVYVVKETFDNLIITTVGRVLIKPLFAVPTLFVMEAAYRWAPFKLAIITPWTLLLALFSYDLVYYVKHRLSHETRLLWAFHAVHHSATRLNFSASARESWFSGCYEWLFLSLLCLAGMSPVLVIIGKTGNIFFQFFLHTTYVGRLGPVEYFFNTPSHHRVHHGSNARYIDRNFGGILIVWDRLFGTFAREDAAEPVVYGTTHPASNSNVFSINCRELILVVKDFCSARSLQSATRTAFGPP